MKRISIVAGILVLLLLPFILSQQKQEALADHDATILEDHYRDSDGTIIFRSSATGSTSTPAVSQVPPERHPRFDRKLVKFLEPLQDTDLARVIVRYKGFSNKDHFTQIKEAGGIFHYKFAYQPWIAVTVSKALLESSLFDPALVERLGGISLDVRMVAQLDSSIPAIKADRAAASYGATGKNVVVGLVDSGVSEHTALRGKVIAEKDFTQSEAGADDESGHGTAIACVIACQDEKYHGVAPDALLVSAKVLDKNGKGYMSDAMAGMEWVLDQGADIVNIGVGALDTECIGYDDFSAMINSYVEEDENDPSKPHGLIVAPAGNYGPESYTLAAPGCAEKVISVGAQNDAGVVADFSSRTGKYNSATVNKPDVYAPGVDVTLAAKNGGFTSLQGTSIAAAHVTGTLALMREIAGKSKTDADLTRILLQNAPRAQDAEFTPTKIPFDVELILKALKAELPETVTPLEPAVKNSAPVFQDIKEGGKASAEMIKMAQYMIDHGTYQMPPLSRFLPNKKAKSDLLIRLALALANQDCGTLLGKKLESACLAKAKNFFPEDKMPKGSLEKAEMYELLLHAAGLPLLDDADIAEAQEGICSDVPGTDREDFRTFVSAYHWGILKTYKLRGKGGYCLPRAPIIRRDVMEVAAWALETKLELEQEAQNGGAQ